VLNQRVWAIVSMVIRISTKCGISSLQDIIQCIYQRSVWTQDRCLIEASVGVAPRSSNAILAIVFAIFFNYKYMDVSMSRRRALRRLLQAGVAHMPLPLIVPQGPTITPLRRYQKIIQILVISQD
jgi:hypothetical protein